MREYLFCLLLFISFNSSLKSQTGIGTTTPNASAKLDVYSTNKGFLPPRVTLTSATDATTIANPAEGLLVYNLGSVGLQAGYYYWNGANWATIATATSAGNGVTASDLVKIYDGVGNAATINSTGATFSVTTSGKYSFDFSTSATCGNCTLEINFQVRDGANSNAVIASDKQTSYSNNVHAEYNGKVEVNLISGRSYNVIVYTTSGYGGIYNNDYTRVYMKQVSGNLPVTGQTVDYLQASLSTNQTLSTAGNIIFNTSSGTGITLSNGGFNLIANKTYKLEAAIGGSSTGYAYYAWVDNTNNLLTGGSTGVVMKAGNTYSDAPQDKAIVYYTPTANTTVYLRVYSISGSLTAYAPSLVSNYSSTWASIQQIGSSAIVNPWTLSGTNTYNTIGSVGIGTTTPGDLLVVGSSIALHDGGDKLVGMGWSPGSGKAILSGYPAEIRLNPSTGKLSLGTDPTSRSVGATAGVQRRMTINSAGNIGIGTEDPTEKLEVTGNVKANNFIGAATSTTLFLLEANSNASYALPGPWVNDNCRYNNVINTVNVSSSWFNTSTYRFTPQKAGYWEIIASYDIYRNAESYLFIQKNGGTVCQSGAFNSINAIVNKIIYLNGSTDYITVVNQGGASNTRTQNTSISWFQARWVGE